MPEQEIYTDQKVAVTTDHVIIAGATYAVRNLTSVRMTVTPPTGCAMIVLNSMGAIMIAAGLLSCLIGATLVLQTYIEPGEHPARQYAADVIIAIVMAIIFVGAGVLVIARSGKARGVNRYNVTFVTSARETQALTSKDEEYIRKIVGTINEAMVRG